MGNTRGFFFDVYWKKLVKPLKVNLTNYRGPSMTWHHPQVFKSQACPHRISVIHHLHIRFSTLALVPAVVSVHAPVDHVSLYSLSVSPIWRQKFVLCPHILLDLSIVDLIFFQKIVQLFTC